MVKLEKHYQRDNFVFHTSGKNIIYSITILHFLEKFRKVKVKLILKNLPSEIL